MSETPYSPAEQPGDDDWTSHASSNPRYSASASVPPPAPPAGQFGQGSQFGQPDADDSGMGQPPASSFGQPPAFGQPPPFAEPSSFAELSSFGEPSTFGQPPVGGLGQPPAGMGQPPAPAAPASGSARVAASASVPAPPLPDYGRPPQGYPAQVSTYGTPSGGGGQYTSSGQTYGTPASASAAPPAPPTASPAPGAFGQPPPGGSQFGQPPGGATYGQSPSGGGQFGQPPGGATYGQSPSGGGQFGQPPSGGSQFGQPQGGGPFGQPQGGGQNYGGPGQYGPPGPGQQYGSQDRAPGASSYGQGGHAPAPEPRGNWGDDEPSRAPARKSKRGLIITLIVAALVVVVGIGGFVGYSMIRNNTTYAVNDCVRKDGGSAVKVDCTADGAYKITALVDAVNKCPDNTQAWLSQNDVPAEHKFACLSPAAS